GFGRSIAYLEPSEDGETATYSLRDLDGNVIGASPPQPFSSGIEPHTGVGYGAGALIAPISATAEFETIDVGYMGPDGSFARVASVPRRDSDEVYSARA